MPQLTSLPSWPDLLTHAKDMEGRDLRGLAQADENRFQALRFCHDGLTLDLARQRLDIKTLARLAQLLKEQNFEKKRDAFLRGKKVNATENRAALHPALRRFDDAPLRLEGVDVMPDILAERKKALAFAQQIRTGAVKGATGKTITHIIHVGIGGSDLGPRLVATALYDAQSPVIHFIRNIDGMALRAVMRACDPETTLVFIASKTFTTAETMLNAKTLLGWLESALGEKAVQHCLALTAAPEKARAFRIDENNIFRFWDWVGGRFSVWSSIGLPAMIALGPAAFEEFLKGASAMDAHFEHAPPAENLPVLMALTEIWNINALGFQARAVLPYAENLADLPAYLQQLEMESLGKAVDHDGHKVHHATAPVIFGATGTPAQHAFMQALHQGPTIIPAEIILVGHDSAHLPDHHRMLLSHGLAQGEALMEGKASADLYKAFSGNRPSTTLLLQKLSPTTLGQLLALYEHKVFTQSVLWHINPFDQWGVELGKELAGKIEKKMR